jgi:hypothetical protein
LSFGSKEVTHVSVLVIETRMVVVEKDVTVFALTLPLGKERLAKIVVVEVEVVVVVRLDVRTMVDFVVFVTVFTPDRVVIVDVIAGTTI